MQTLRNLRPPQHQGAYGGINTQTHHRLSVIRSRTTPPPWQDPVVYNPKVNYSKLLGRHHTLKEGYEYQSIITAIDDFNRRYAQDITRPVSQKKTPRPPKAIRCTTLSTSSSARAPLNQLTNFTKPISNSVCHFAYLKD